MAAYMRLTEAKKKVVEFILSNEDKIIDIYGEGATFDTDCWRLDPINPEFTLTITFKK